MGRHADRTARRRPVPLVLLAAAVVLVAGGLIWWLAGSDSTGPSPSPSASPSPSPSPGCDARATVAVTVAPELGELTEQLLAEEIGVDDRLCVDTTVATQQPLQTVGDLSGLEADALPDVWIPDSSLWAARVADAPLEAVGSLATSPVVLATSRAAVESHGWTDQPPGWVAALAGSVAHPIAVPDLATSTEGLTALAAVRTALGDEEAGNAVVQAVLAAQRGPALSAADGLAAGRSGSIDAPLMPVSEQEVYAINTAAEDSALVAVYPGEGSPVLDYPVLRVGSPEGNEALAVAAVVRTLTSDAARAAAVEAGFRDGGGAVPPNAADAGIRAEAPTPLEVDPAAVQALVAAAE